MLSMASTSLLGVHGLDKSATGHVICWGVPRPPSKRPPTMRPDPVSAARLACKGEIEKAIAAVEARLESLPLAAETLALRCYELGQKSMLVLEQARDQRAKAERDFADRNTPLIDEKTNPGTRGARNKRKVPP